MRVFLSHRTDVHATLAQRLATDLESHGMAAWIAPRDLDPGSTWPQAIEQGLQSCTHVAVLLSPRTMESRAVQLEVQMAEMLSIEGKAVILPLLIEAMVLPPWLSVIQNVDFTTSYQDGLANLMKTLSGSSPDPSTPALGQPQSIFGESAPRVRVHAVCAGERIDLLAASSLSDPRDWRTLMAANQNIDPRRLEPGADVVLSSDETSK